MKIDESKNTLYILDEDVEINDLTRQSITIENSLVLQSGSISLPFDDFMRSIIIAVYQNNIEEIVVVNNPNKSQKKNLWNRVLEEIQEEIQEKIQTLNYLFKNCKPELFESDLSEWFEGVEIVSGEQNAVNIIRQHPLMPPEIKITEMTIFKENENLSVMR